MAEVTHPNEINRDYIRLLQVMSRFIKEEFTLSIRMTQEDAVELLLHYAEQSRNSVLQEMGKELREFTYGPEAAEPAAAEPAAGEEGVRYYRGAPVAGSGGSAKTPVKEKAPVEKAVPEKSKPTRVYRGQVISG